MIPQSNEVAGYTLRQVVKTDLALVLRHRHDMFLELGFEREAAEAATRASKEMFGQALANGRYLGFFAEDSSPRVVAGGGVITHEFHTGPREVLPRRSWIVNVYTEPEHRRRGLARTIVQALVNLCRAQGWPVVFLHASDDGRPLYESMGFRATNEMLLKL